MNQQSKWGGTTAQVLELLAAVGPMTRAEICRQIGRSKNDIASVVSRLNKASKARPKRVYIKDYIYEQSGERSYPRAVFDLGDLADQPHPGPQDPHTIKARYWARWKDRLSRVRWWASMLKFEEQVVYLLTELGPMTAGEIKEEAGRQRYRADVLEKMAFTKPVSDKQLHITRYETVGDKLVAVYAAGAKANASKPKATEKKLALSRAKYRVERLRTNSVFNLGLTKKAAAARLKDKTCTTSSESTPA
jgi:hypothetical protein